MQISKSISNRSKDNGGAVNKLADEKSPYLLQHAYNPVDWFPWGEEAFDKARSENKPVFLSIGYSTCHWCHVMAHESFEDIPTAKILNDKFISVKVDREERPDIDSVYMAVCQAFTGSGGWPMSIFMTPDKNPFYAGTYFPVDSRYGMPSFKNLLHGIAEQWENNRIKLVTSAEEIVNHIHHSFAVENRNKSENLIESAFQTFKRTFDNKYGGFGVAPKFPSPHNLLFLILYSEVYHDKSCFEMVKKTLYQMRFGGIFDHIGYGFSRYSTDQYFLAPHFEKMLYDNALLIMAYASAYSISGDKLFLDTCEKTAEYILREMISSDGGFYSAQDADSDGVEGKFYTFQYSEIIKVLGSEKGKKFAEVFDITKTGNFEGVNIPNLLKSKVLSNQFDDEIKELYDYRKQRTKLHLDDKILISWNSLMITAFCMLYRITKKSIYLENAEKSQKFIENHLYYDNCLYTSYRNKVRSNKGFLDDYVFYITALMELYHSTLDQSYLDKAEFFCKEVIKSSRFYDEKEGGFFLCEANQAELFINPKETYDGAIPSGNSVMAYNLVRLYQLTEKDEYEDMTKKQLDFLSFQSQDYSVGSCMYLLSQLLYENPPKHITVVLKEKLDIDIVKKYVPFLANVTVLECENKQYPLVNNSTTYYICENHTCFPPTNDVKEICKVF